MAIINCPECEHKISSLAVSCPHCGFNIAKQQKEKEIEEIKLKYTKIINGYYINLMELYILRDRNCKWAADSLSKITNIRFKDAQNILFNFYDEFIEVNPDCIQEYIDKTEDKKLSQSVNIYNYTEKKTSILKTAFSIVLAIFLVIIILFLLKLGLFATLWTVLMK